MTLAAPAPLDAPLPRGRALGVGLAGVIVLAAVAGTWLALVPGERSLHGLVQDNVLTNAVEGAEIGLVAAALCWLRPGHRLGWLLLYVAGAQALAILGEGWALASYHMGLPGRTFAVWLGSWVWVGAMVVGPTVVPAIYPHGRAEDRVARAVVRGGAACAVVLSCCLALLDVAYQGVLPGRRLGHNPVSGGHAQLLLQVLAGVAAVAALALAAFTLAWTVRRLRRAVSPLREQLAWLMASVVPSVFVALVAPPAVAFVVNLFAGAALLIGVVRHQLFDIELVLRSGLVYGLLLGATAGAYFGAVGLITLVTPPGTVPSLFAAGAVALLLVPAYRVVARRANRFVYGDRADPVRALSRLQLGEGQGGDLASMAAAVATAVRSPHVAVVAPDGAVIAESGAPSPHAAEEIALRHEGETVGVLTVARRTPVDGFSAADRRLIAALAGPVAVAVRAVRLTAELGESRARVIAVRESERRRLRNDLHDGLGPSLSGVALGIEAALRAEDPQAVGEILRVVHHEVAGLVGEVRGLIDELGPAGLDRGGLVTALRAQAEAVGALTGVTVSVDAEEPPVLPGPLEVALHRVAGEALTNVARHAGAEHAWVRLAVRSSGVLLEVADDGCGLGASPAGVGRTSMAERIASVGGSLELADRPGGGTVLRVAVPVDLSVRSEP